MSNMLIDLYSEHPSTDLLTELEGLRRLMVRGMIKTPSPDVVTVCLVSGNGRGLCSILTNTTPPDIVNQAWPMRTQLINVRATSTDEDLRSASLELIASAQSQLAGLP